MSIDAHRMPGARCVANVALYRNGLVALLYAHVVLRGYTFEDVR